MTGLTQNILVTGLTQNILVTGLTQINTCDWDKPVNMTLLDIFPWGGGGGAAQILTINNLPRVTLYRHTNFHLEYNMNMPSIQTRPIN